MSAVKTRFAPSPTGYLHLGSARTCLFNSLFARSQNGTWFLRLEDTDRNRLQPEAFDSLVNALSQVGLIPDEGITLESIGEKDEFYGVNQKGDFGPYIQSQRLEIYHLQAQSLIDSGYAYWDFLTSDERNELQEIKQATKKAINYFQINSQKMETSTLNMSVQAGLQDSRKPALRYKLQREKHLTCTDALLGETTFDLSLEEDPVFLKSDGFPTYHLAHLVDDYMMKTTHIIRSQEWYPSLPLHTQMYIDTYGKALIYLHLPVILGETGNKKMSKRDGNVNIQDYLDKGYLPEALINYIAFLGWNPGTEKELYLDTGDFELAGN